MFKAMKSELTKLLSGVMIYICTVITILLSIIDFAATKLVTILNPEAIPQLVEKYGNMTSQSYILNSLMSLFSGGAIFIVISVVVAALISEDYGRGTMKYSLLAISRQRLVLGKIATIGVINGIFIVASFVVATIIGFLFFNWNPSGHSIFQLLVVYLLGWLTLFGFSSLVTFMINRVSKMSGAIGLGIGTYMIISMVGAFAPKTIKPLILTANFGKVMDMTLSAWSEVAFTNIAYIVVFSILVLISFRKKEILY